MATLAHELGHLFCSHVGADPSDPWSARRPARSVGEFEAESVALVVYKRVAPRPCYRRTSTSGSTRHRR
ncbi:hypothetical protein [Nocardioides sp. Root140]|uniref:hypothetical protein n=1 Tax=Nocardioides sp. Root140 TaxID=1736460 RepID=UPI003FA60125